MTLLSVLSAVDPMTILWSALVLLALAAVFGILLAVLGKKFAVKENERRKRYARTFRERTAARAGMPAATLSPRRSRKAKRT